MGPTWVLSAPDVPHVGPMNLAMGALFHVGCDYSPIPKLQWQFS